MERKEYTYKVADDAPITADVYYSTQRTEGKRPIAVHFHGGNFIVGAKWMLSPHQAARLVELGFVIVSANYRLCPSISLYDGPITDALDAYNWSHSTLPGLLKSDTGIEVDESKLVALGHSCGATLALLTASTARPPLALLDLFGIKYISDPFWHTAKPAPPSDAPKIDSSFSKRIYTEIPAPSAGPSPMGPSGPDLSNHRVAWMMTAVGQGKLISAVVGDNDYDRVDPTSLFTNRKFPPTYFIHGMEDRLVPAAFSQRAHDELNGVGIETELVLIPGAGHAFDVKAAPGDKEFDIVTKGLEFLRNHV